LRQFILNANLLTDNAALAQTGRTAGVENSIFMIPGAADALGRPADPKENFGGNTNGAFTIQPQSGLPTITDPVVLDGYTQADAQPNSVAAPGAPDSNLLIELDGTGAGAAVDGLSITAGNSTVSGFVINRFAEDGIYITTNGSNTISGNYIGTNVAGTLDRGNLLRGINVEGSNNNTIGGTNPADRNLISGNDQEGLNIRNGSAANTALGNYIGTSVAGDAPLGNAWEGIQIWDAGAGNIIGGNAAGAGNVVSGNGRSGVRMDGVTCTGTLIRGNVIGLNAAGDAAVANTEDGVYISATGNNNVVGGSDASYRNVISGNLGNGVRITSNANYADIRWNYIGINTAGTAVIANTLDGILVEGGSDHTDIYNNWIGGNLGNGIQVTGAGSNTTIIRLNYIGTDSTWTRDFGNDGHGIYLRNGVMDTRIGNNAMASGVNTIFNNAGDGIRVEDAATTFNYVQITRTFNNGGLGINLVGGTEDGFGVTANDLLDGDSGANNLQNYATITAASSNGTNVSLNWSLNTLASQTNRYVLFFYLSSAADPSGSGEGRRYLGMRANVSTDAGGNASGAELFIPVATNDLGLGAVTPGSVVTVSAWDQLSGDASEYSTAFPVTVTGTNTISGTVYEDVNGDADLADGVGVVTATVRLYADDGDNVPDAGDGAAIDTTATDGSGGYTFGSLVDGTYWVAVDSRTITPAAGLTGVLGDVWAEQTYGISGARCDNGSGTTVEIGSAGACFSGQLGNRSDDAASGITSTEHLTRVVVSGGNVTGVDSAFSFNVVTNTLAGDAQDDDGGNNRTVQGSLRQFIQNANGVSGANAMRFVPAEPTNASGSGQNWWRVTVTNTLEAIDDADTTINGTAYDFSDGTTIRNTNATTLGYVGAVGLGADAVVSTGDEPTLGGVQGPELEIVNDRATNVVAIGLDLQADDITIDNISIFGFGNGDLGQDANIRAGIDSGSAFTGIVIEDSVIGTSAADFSDPGVAARSLVSGVAVFGADGGSIRRNLIGYHGRFGIFLSDTAQTWTVQSNEIRANALENFAQDGIDIGNGSGGVTVSGNLFAMNMGAGVDGWNGLGNTLIENNTFLQNGLGGID